MLDILPLKSLIKIIDDPDVVRVMIGWKTIGTIEQDEDKVSYRLTS